MYLKWIQLGSYPPVCTYKAHWVRLIGVPSGLCLKGSFEVSKQLYKHNDILTDNTTLIAQPIIKGLLKVLFFIDKQRKTPLKVNSKGA